MKGYYVHKGGSTLVYTSLCCLSTFTNTQTIRQMDAFNFEAKKTDTEVEFVLIGAGRTSLFFT